MRYYVEYTLPFLIKQPNFKLKVRRCFSKVYVKRGLCLLCVVQQINDAHCKLVPKLTYLSILAAISSMSTVTDTARCSNGCLSSFVLLLSSKHHKRQSCVLCVFSIKRQKVRDSHRQLPIRASFIYRP